MRLLIAEDEVLLREGLAQLLTANGFEVVGQVSDAEELVRRAIALKPDVAIVDIRMPPTHSEEGLRAAEELYEQAPEVGVLVLSKYVEPDYAVRLLEKRDRGVGYLLKDGISDVGGFVDALRRVGEGGSAVDPAVIASLVRRHRTEDPLGDLTDREREMLSLLAQGLTNRGIGRQMFLSSRTVEAHLRSIFSKLDLASTPDDNRRVLAVVRYLDSR